VDTKKQKHKGDSTKSPEKKFVYQPYTAHAAPGTAEWHYGRGLGIKMLEGEGGNSHFPAAYARGVCRNRALNALAKDVHTKLVEVELIRILVLFPARDEISQIEKFFSAALPHRKFEIKGYRNELHSADLARGRDLYPEPTGVFHYAIGVDVYHGFRDSTYPTLCNNPMLKMFLVMTPYLLYPEDYVYFGSVHIKEVETSDVKRVVYAPKVVEGEVIKNPETNKVVYEPREITETVLGCSSTDIHFETSFVMNTGEGQIVQNTVDDINGYVHPGNGWMLNRPRHAYVGGTMMIHTDKIIHGLYNPLKVVLVIVHVPEILSDEARFIHNRKPSLLFRTNNGIRKYWAPELGDQCRVLAANVNSDENQKGMNATVLFLLRNQFRNHPFIKHNVPQIVSGCIHYGQTLNAKPDPLPEGYVSGPTQRTILALNAIELEADLPISTQIMLALKERKISYLAYRSWNIIKKVFFISVDFLKELLRSMFKGAWGWATPGSVILQSIKLVAGQGRMLRRYVHQLLHHRSFGFITKGYSGMKGVDILGAVVFAAVSAVAEELLCYAIPSARLALVLFEIGVVVALHISGEKKVFIPEMVGKIVSQAVWSVLPKSISLVLHFGWDLATLYKGDAYLADVMRNVLTYFEQEKVLHAALTLDDDLSRIDNALGQDMKDFVPGVQVNNPTLNMIELGSTLSDFTVTTEEVTMELTPEIYEWASMTAQVAHPSKFLAVTQSSDSSVWIPGDIDITHNLVYKRFGEERLFMTPANNLVNMIQVYHSRLAGGGQVVMSRHEIDAMKWYGEMFSRAWKSNDFLSMDIKDISDYVLDRPWNAGKKKAYLEAIRESYDAGLYRSGVKNLSTIIKMDEALGKRSVDGYLDDLRIYPGECPDVIKPRPINPVNDGSVSLMGIAVPTMNAMKGIYYFTAEHGNMQIEHIGWDWEKASELQNKFIFVWATQTTPDLLTKSRRICDIGSVILFASGDDTLFIIPGEGEREFDIKSCDASTTKPHHGVLCSFLAEHGWNQEQITLHYELLDGKRTYLNRNDYVETLTWLCRYMFTTSGIFTTTICSTFQSFLAYYRYAFNYLVLKNNHFASGMEESQKLISIFEKHGFTMKAGKWGAHGTGRFLAGVWFETGTGPIWTPLSYYKSFTMVPDVTVYGPDVAHSLKVHAAISARSGALSIDPLGRAIRDSYLAIANGVTPSEREWNIWRQRHWYKLERMPLMMNTGYIISDLEYEVNLNNLLRHLDFLREGEKISLSLCLQQIRSVVRYPAKVEGSLSWLWAIRYA